MPNINTNIQTLQYNTRLLFGVIFIVTSKEVKK